MTEAQIKHMTERFLRWRLPDDFNPDGGIVFLRQHGVFSDGQTNSQPIKYEPVGTNLLSYTQAAAMVRHMAEGIE